MKAQSNEAVANALLQPAYEIIPMDGVAEQISHLPVDAKVRVTASPSKGMPATLRLAEQVAERGLEVIPHVSARGVTSHAELREILDRCAGAGVTELFLVGGDRVEPAGPFADSFALLSAIQEIDHSIRRIGITAYPEGHPSIEEEVLLRDLQAKAPYASYMTSQICFDPEAILAWLLRVRHLGIDLPAEIGIPGVVRRAKLLKISLKVGVGDSVRFLRKNGGTVSRLFAGQGPGSVLGKLAPFLADEFFNIGGFHIYTFNEVERTEQWRRALLQQSAQPVNGAEG